MIRRIHLLPLLLPLVAACSGVTPPPEAAGAQSDKREVVRLSDLSGDFLYLAAQDAINEGNFALAAQFLGELARRAPESVAPRQQYAELLIHLGRPTLAAEELDALLALTTLSDAERSACTRLKAQALIANGDLAGATQLVAAMVQAQPQDLALRKMLVQLYLQQNDPLNANLTVNEAIRRGDSAELRLLQAQILIQQKRYEEAGVALKALLKMEPDNEQAAIMLADLAQQRGDKGQSEQILREFLKQNPDMMRAANNLGRLLVGQGRSQEAIAIYEDMDRRTEGNPDVLYALGLLYYEQKIYDKSARIFERIVAMNPSDQASFYYAASLEMSGEKEQAKQIYASIAREDGSYPDAQIRLASLEYQEGQYDAAIARLKELLKTAPQDGDIYLLMTVVRLKQKHFRELLSESEPALQLPTVPLRIFFNRAIAFEALENLAELEGSLRRMLEVEPENPEALNFLGYALADRNQRLPEAKALIERALAQRPEDPFFLDSLGWVLYRLGDYAAAIATQRKAIGLMGDDPTMHEHLGDMLWANGDHEEARMQWQKALDLGAEKPESMRRKLEKGL